MTWHEDVVEVEDGRYGSTEHWVEPLAAFTGLVQYLARFSYLDHLTQYEKRNKFDYLLFAMALSFHKKYA